MNRPGAVVFDLDGTLVESSPRDAHNRHDLEVLAAAAPIPHVAAYARRLRAAGTNVVVATSRPPRVRDATIACLKRCGLWPITLHERSSRDFDLETSIADKVAVCRAVGASFIVGDRDDLEGAAAADAGIRFLHVEQVPKAVPRGDEFELRARALDLVHAERDRQNAKWGFRVGHPLTTWNVILTEEVGEVARAIIGHEFDHHKAPPEGWRENLKLELSQVAAVALAALQDILAREEEEAAKLPEVVA
jgi:phosphoglycolate phosphatase-like HAD superfamily hydrolase